MSKDAANIGYLPSGNPLTFKEYQEETKATASYPKDIAVLFCTVALAGETGEVCEKIKKVFRDHNGVFTWEKKLAIAKELGDALWYMSQLAAELDLDLEGVASDNLKKLRDRILKDKLSGSGDDR